MIRSITVTNHLGDSIKLELTRPDKTGFIVGPIAGLGPPKATINTSKTAASDGATYNSAFLDIRNVTMNLAFQETKTESIEDIRQKSYRYFPVKKNVELLIETDNRLVRTNGLVESNEPDIFSQNEGCNISIICPDPFLYTYEVNEVAFYGVQPTFEFSYYNKNEELGTYGFSNESLYEPLLEMGLIENKTENIVHYEGDSEIGMTIIIHALGDVTHLTIYDIVSREKMVIDTDKMIALTGSAIIAGDTIIINTRTGHKSITLLRGGDETNILNCLDKDADWLTLTKGDNAFAFIAESGRENLQFSIVHELVYDGV